MKTNKQEPVLSTSQIFNNPNVGYTFVFSKKIGEGGPIASYELESTETSARTYSASSSQDEFTVITIPVNFTQEMGLLCESEWNCYVLVSTGTLKYKIGEFGISCDASDKDNLPTQEGGTATTHADIKDPSKFTKEYDG
jgi:hypothetical protein